MQRVNSPWADRALYWYGLIVAGSHDPAVWLAIGLREHRLLTDPNAVALKLDTNSWTNARSVRIEGMDHDIVTTADLRNAGIINRQGPYVRYRSIAESLQDGMRRIDDPTYVYHRRFGAEPSIGQVLSLWTESEAVQYTDYVVGKLNEWSEVEMTAQIPGFAWHPADDRHYTRGRSDTIKGFAVHYTGRPTDNGSSLTWLSTHPNSNVSATFLIKHQPTLVDRGWQLVRIEDTPHTTGQPVNNFTVSLEYELKNGQSIPDVAYDVMAATIRESVQYVADNGLGAIPLNRDAIRGHNEWAGMGSTICPDGISVDRIVNLMQHTEAEREINGYPVRGAILKAYAQLELDGEHWWLLGLPIEHEETEVPVDGILRTVQRFDRCGFVMTEGDGVVIAKPDQQRQIEAALGINDERAARLDRILDAAKTIIDEAKVLAE